VGDKDGYREYQKSQADLILLVDRLNEDDKEY
jgi:hypothetical protein